MRFPGIRNSAFSLPFCETRCKLTDENEETEYIHADEFLMKKWTASCFESSINTQYEHN